MKGLLKFYYPNVIFLFIKNRFCFSNQQPPTHLSNTKKIIIKMKSALSERLFLPQCFFALFSSLFKHCDGHQITLKSFGIKVFLSVKWDTAFHKRAI